MATPWSKLRTPRILLGSPCRLYTSREPLVAVAVVRSSWRIRFTPRYRSQSRCTGRDI
ncbi:hypothetical protein C8Q76DRAFT_751132 [Earliella scabrosa]|nr:hypothetical protein C8Q76DRAFT_751132 [Earliella scabrosa]